MVSGINYRLMAAQTEKPDTPVSGFSHSIRLIVVREKYLPDRYLLTAKYQRKYKGYNNCPYKVNGQV